MNTCVARFSRRVHASLVARWDGFRALVSTVDGLRVPSGRGSNMTHLLPELRYLPRGLVLDGELG